MRDARDMISAPRHWSRFATSALRARLHICTIAALGALCLPGCYERTIRTEGWGYQNKPVQKPLAPDDGPVEEFIFGPRKTTKVDEKPQPRPKPG